MPRLHLGHRDAAGGTSVSLREELGRLGLAVANNLDDAFRELERGLERVGNAAAVLGAHDRSIDDDRDVVVLALVELRRVGELDRLPVDDRADEPLLPRRLEQVAELALSTADQRRKDLDSASLRPGKHRIRNLDGT